jgi:hypothetical protein
MKVRTFVAGLLFVMAVTGFSYAENFKVFSSGEVSWTAPDGRYTIHTVERDAAASKLPGAFHALVLEDARTGSSRQLCNYYGTLAVAWSQDDFVIVTEYVNRSNARTMVFAPSQNSDPVVITPRHLAKLLPADIGAHLIGNDHVYVEAATVEQDRLKLRVWGYGARDASGFSLRCEYGLQDGTATCQDAAQTTASIF